MLSTLKFKFAAGVLLLTSVMVGCGPPALQPVTGNVTLGGKPKNRIIVYFSPIEGKLTEYTHGVGETNAEGKLQFGSTAGNGIAVGTYRVFFSCVTVRGDDGPIPEGEKADDDRNVEIIEMVPEPYCNDAESPVEFEVKPGENVFNFDIPTS